MSEKQRYYSVIASGGTYVCGTDPNCKPRLVIPRNEFEDGKDKRPVFWANVGRIVDAADKRERKRAKTRTDCRRLPG